MSADQLRARRVDSSVWCYYVVQVRKWWGWKTIDTANTADEARHKI